MDALSWSSCVIRGRGGPPSLSSSFLGDGIQPKRECNFGVKSRRNCVTALSSGILGVGVPESLAQLQLELSHRLGAVGLPLAADAGESSVLLAAAAAPFAWWYISAAPGSLGGLLDYASTPVLSHSHKSFNPEDVEVGRQIGQGSFGVVYEGYFGRGKRKESQAKEIRVILKKVKPGIRGAAEMHATEEYMNRRVQRTAPNACAEFLGTTLVSRSQSHGRLTEGLWLIWKFEGGRTLDYYLKQRNFPDNIEEYILGNKKRKEPTSTKAGRLERSNAVIRRIMFQILSNLRDLHSTGLVHRDVKPLNLILAEDEGTIKLIDLGACVDVRSGYNYVPDETVIDPTYAAPEHHIMPTSTPHLPPDPLCSLISPLVWALNTPDRFDLYSAGLVMLQMAVKPLRQDINLHSFNTELKRAGYDLDKWRERCRFSDEDFELLDADGGAGWELVKATVQPRHDKELAIWPSLGSSRPSAAAALKHRFFSPSFINLPSFKTFSTLPSFVFSSLKTKEPKGSEKHVVIPALRNPTTKEVGRSPKHIVIPALRNPTSKEVGRSPNHVVIPALRNPTSTEVGRSPKHVVPVVHSDVAPNRKYVPAQLEFDTSQILPAIGALTQPALAVGASWMMFSGLRSTAEATYSMGQSLTQSVGISGTAFVGFFLIVKPWLEAQIDKQRKDKLEAQMDKQRKDKLKAQMDKQRKDEIEAQMHQKRKDKLSVNASTKVDRNLVGHNFSIPDARVETSITTIRHHSEAHRRSHTGLAEAVKEMELQLASLEASIHIEREFAKQQQQRIFQLEKLLTRTPPLSVSTKGEKSNENISTV